MSEPRIRFENVDGLNFTVGEIAQIQFKPSFVGKLYLFVLRDGTEVFVSHEKIVGAVGKFKLETANFGEQ